MTNRLKGNKVKLEMGLVRGPALSVLYRLLSARVLSSCLESAASRTRSSALLYERK